MRGEVVRYDAIKGYAFVAADGLDEDVFLHVNDIDFDKALLAVGAVVELDHEMGERGPRALSASLVRSPVADAVQAAMAGDRLPPAEPGTTTSPVPSSHAHDGFADVLSAAELRGEVTERLLAAAGDLTGRQVLAVRGVVERIARAHGWLDA
ncbi:putative cold-shock DNA-binding protein [Isoptericola sp. CG 20/1183]|uniref:Cold-shock DNA-binding protein n=1 Tax=Isoptericola halotolerans TaxID=300560 RepID=A0ABX5ED78_9MICO|nr:MULTISPECIES: cold shock domain-containing protein [Isoptericola]PRZ05729.1 putative cold-shock DNA-binding protein [Isoptericola halotolerans]PRZ06297.1 putative cold-shock DNA-binding protein [Isoptericola sp. CG 20/1183]